MIKNLFIIKNKIKNFLVIKFEIFEKLVQNLSFLKINLKLFPINTLILIILWRIKNF